MKAVYLVEPGHLELRQVPDPIPGPRDVVVRVRCSTTCGTDLKAYRRGHRLIPMPGPLGHEFAGEIAAVGDEVTGWRAGQRVAGVQSAPCGRCPQCARGQENLCTDLLHLWGAFAEFMLLPERHHRVNLIAAETDAADAVLCLVEPLACVVHGQAVLGSLAQARTVLVLGAAAIGLMHVQLLRRRFEGRLVAAGKHEPRLALARQFGANSAIDITREDGETALTEALGGPRADVVIECVGRPEAWQAALARTGPGGRTLLFGGCPSGTTLTVDAGKLHYEEIQLLGSFHFTPREVRQAYGLIARREVDLAPLITGELPLAQVETAFAGMSSGRGIKYALRP